MGILLVVLTPLRLVNEAVLAMGRAFTIHFTVEHWRPSSFPYNASMFDGSVELEVLRPF